MTTEIAEKQSSRQTMSSGSVRYDEVVHICNQKAAGIRTVDFVKTVNCLLTHNLYKKVIKDQINISFENLRAKKPSISFESKHCAPYLNHKPMWQINYALYLSLSLNWLLPDEPHGCLKSLIKASYRAILQKEAYHDIVCCRTLQDFSKLLDELLDFCFLPHTTVPFGPCSVSVRVIELFDVVSINIHLFLRMDSPTLFFRHK